MADMGPLYATFDPSDAEHERAQGDIERLNVELSGYLLQGRGRVTSRTTLTESVSRAAATKPRQE